MEVNTINNINNNYNETKHSSITPNIEKAIIKDDLSKDKDLRKDIKNDEIEDADISKLKTVISQANSKIKSTQKRFEFSYHEKTKRVSIKIFDKETDKIIREIPPEEALEMIEKLWEIAGLFIDERK